MDTREELEEKMRKAGRLPPGQVLTQKFPILHFGLVPVFDPQNWDFRLWGEVESPVTLTWEEIQQLPRTKTKMDLHCVTRWSKLDTEWEGVALQTFVDEGILQLKESARYLIQHAENGFSANLPLEIAFSDNFLLATHYQGQPITPDHGFPLRGVVGAIPGRRDLKDVYLWKGAKWLRGLEFSNQDKPGFWEQAGYHNEADIWEEQRFE